MLTGPLILPRLLGWESRRGESASAEAGRSSDLLPQRCTWTPPARSATPPSIRPRKARGLLRYKLAVNSGPRCVDFSGVNQISDRGDSSRRWTAETFTEACSRNCIGVSQLLSWHLWIPVSILHTGLHGPKHLWVCEGKVLFGMSEDVRDRVCCLCP